MSPSEAQAYIIGNVRKTEEILLSLGKSLGFYLSRPVISEDGEMVLEKGERIDGRKLFLMKRKNVKEVWVHRKPRIFVGIENDHIRQILLLLSVEEGFEIGIGRADFFITGYKPQRVKFLVSGVDQDPASNLAVFTYESGVMGFFVDGSISDAIVSAYIYIFPALRSSFGSSDPYPKKMYLPSANTYKKGLGGRSLFLPARITEDSLVEILDKEDESYLICDALVHIPPDVYKINEEDELEVYLIR
jgi:molybdopterin biosynthesis enzyme